MSPTARTMMVLLCYSTLVTPARSQGFGLRDRLDASPGGTLPGNRPGLSIGRSSPSTYRQDRQPIEGPTRLAPLPTIGDLTPRFTGPEETSASKLAGDPNGLSLERAIRRMIDCNPTVAAAKEQAVQARADVVTAGLRANPQFFADLQQVPYRVLAPGQVDVNLAYPLDVSGKRRTRIASAACVVRAVEWRYVDFLRLQVDGLMTTFTDALWAQVSFDDYSGPKGAGSPFRVDPNEASPKEEAETAVRDRQLALALLLNDPAPKSIRVQGYLFDPRNDRPIAGVPPLPPLDWFKKVGFDHRPDLNAARWDLRRSLADVEAVRAAKLDDVSFLVEPYTYSPALPNHVGWAFGVTVPLPVYNRQQGNLAKAESIVRQSRLQLAATERVVAFEVESAYNDVADSWDDLVRFYREQNESIRVPPRKDRVDDPTSPVGRNLIILNEAVTAQLKREEERRRRNFTNAILRHRKGLLKLNTATGCTIIRPDEPPPELPDEALKAPDSK